jgi:hypothetical protein
MCEAVPIAMLVASLQDHPQAPDDKRGGTSLQNVGNSFRRSILWVVNSNRVLRPFRQERRTNVLNHLLGPNAA